MVGGNFIPSVKKPSMLLKISFHGKRYKLRRTNLWHDVLSPTKNVVTKTLFILTARQAQIVFLDWRFNMAICNLKCNICDYCMPGPCPFRTDEAGDED